MRAAVLLLLIISLSFALIDPPIDDVNRHDASLARNATLHVNPYGLPMRVASINDPMDYAYVRILTIIPSVNGTVFPSIHPSLVWLAAESHERSVTLDLGDGNCSRTRTVRYFDTEPVTDDLATEYSIDGLNGTPAILRDTVEVRGNPDGIPFEDSMPDVSSFGMLSNKTMIIRYPRLNVSLDWSFHISYRQEQTVWYLSDDGSCESDGPFLSNGTITYNESDSASYEVQNNRSLIIPVSPGLLSLDADTTPDPSYKLGFLSDGMLYKYYIRMDNQTAGACYFYNFSVETDKYGVETISAAPVNGTFLLPDGTDQVFNGTFTTEDCRSQADLIDGSSLNQSHKFSNVYYFLGEFQNLSPGNHLAELQFYGLDGRHESVISNITAKGETSLSVSAFVIGDQLIMKCLLTSNGTPVPGREIELAALGETMIGITDQNGSCSQSFAVNKSTVGVSARFLGDGRYLPSIAYASVIGLHAPSAQGDILGSGSTMLFIIVGLLGFSLLRLTDSAIRVPYPSAVSGTRHAGSNRLSPVGRSGDSTRNKKREAAKVALIAASGGASTATATQAGQTPSTSSRIENAQTKENETIKRLQDSSKSKGKPPSKQYRDRMLKFLLSSLHWTQKDRRSDGKSSKKG